MVRIEGGKKLGIGRDEELLIEPALHAHRLETRTEQCPKTDKDIRVFDDPQSIRVTMAR